MDIYHYTIICVIQCASIEQKQQGFDSRPCTHTHTCCASSRAVIGGVSVLVATAQVLSAGLVCVRSMTAWRPLILTRARAHTLTHRALMHSLRLRVIHNHINLSNSHRHLYICVYIWIYQKHFVSITDDHTHSHAYIHLVL